MSGLAFYYLCALLSGFTYYAVWRLHTTVGPIAINENDVYAFLPGLAAIGSAALLRWAILSAGPVKMVGLGVLFWIQVIFFTLICYIPYDWMWRFFSSASSSRGLTVPALRFPGGFVNYISWHAPRVWETFGRPLPLP